MMAGAVTLVLITRFFSVMPYRLLKAKDGLQLELTPNLCSLGSL